MPSISAYCRMETCCGYYSLKKGALIIGCIDTIIHAILCIGIILIISNDSLWHFVSDNFLRKNQTKYLSEEEENHIKLFKSFMKGKLIVLSVKFCIAVLLVVGVYKEKFALVTGYIFVTIFGCVVTGVGIISDLLQSFVYSTVISLLYLAPQIYFIIVVISYRKQMIEDGVFHYPQRSNQRRGRYGPPNWSYTGEYGRYSEHGGFYYY